MSKILSGLISNKSRKTDKKKIILTKLEELHELMSEFNPDFLLLDPLLLK